MKTRNIFHCPICLTDASIFCPRDMDAQCLHCGLAFCGAHIGPHLQKVHCVILGLYHCRSSIEPAPPTLLRGEE